MQGMFSDDDFGDFGIDSDKMWKWWKA
jgi:hypothetical protein